jgi:20S proteasome alpha/beta subunit
MLTPKPHHFPFSHPQPKPKRLRERRRKNMTLIAAFRARNNGILLCSDREEDDGVSKRAVDKIYRIREFIPCQVFIAGAGPSTVIKNTCTEIHESIKRAMDSGDDILVGHRNLFEACLKSIHKKYAKVLQSWPMRLIIVFAPRSVGSFPLLYQTEGEMLSIEPLYVAQGSGKAISDYLADRLYRHGLTRDTLVVLATFIFREAGESSSGVGLGADMILINDGEQALQFIGPEPIKEVEAGIPSLTEAIDSHWRDHVKIPDWLKR